MAEVTRHFSVPGTEGLKIEALYAWVAVEPDGGEGIIGATIDGVVMPLVGADLDRMRSLRPLAEATRQHTGYPVRLVRYGMREHLEDLP